MLFHCPGKKMSDGLALGRLPLVDGAVAAVAGVADGFLEPLDHVVVGVVEGDRAARKERCRERERERDAVMQRA